MPRSWFKSFEDGIKKKPRKKKEPNRMETIRSGSKLIKGRGDQIDDILKKATR